VLELTGKDTYRAMLPRGTLPEALHTLGRMMSTYRVGMLVYEEVWYNRSVDSATGGLTLAEVDAILTGDGIGAIRIERYLWQVVAVEPPTPVRVSTTSWAVPGIVVARCDSPATHRISADEVGIRFSQPYAPELADIAAVYNRRLSARLEVDRERADVEWRLKWLLSLRATGTPLTRWTTEANNGVPLLTEESAAFMSALTWWGDKQVDEWGTRGTFFDPEPARGYRLARDPKMMVPRTATCSLAALLRGDSAVRPTRPEPIRTRHVIIPAKLANPYEMYRNAAGGQPVELQTLASYLGSSAHLVAAFRAIEDNSALPTGLVDVAHTRWKSLREYVAGLSDVVIAVGDALRLTEVAAVEFPVYWCGLAAGNKFVHSRIDALTENKDGSYDVWEFKTKWGRRSRDPPFADIRQVVLYCYMFVMQTGFRVRLFHLRYVRITPSGSIARVTHTYRFDKSLRGFLDEAFSRTETWDEASIPGIPEGTIPRPSKLPPQPHWSSDEAHGAHPPLPKGKVLGASPLPELPQPQWSSSDED